MMTRIGVLWVLSAFSLASCAAPGGVDEDSHNFRPPLGTAVVLQQALTVPQGHARVFLQRGKVVEKRHLDSYRPHCNFEQRRVSDGSATIAADRFIVTAVSDGEDYVVQREGLMHADWRVTSGGDMPSMINRYFDLTLDAPTQPQVVRLTCHGGFDFPGQAQLPSLRDIRNALGLLATIELP